MKLYSMNKNLAAMAFLSSFFVSCASYVDQTRSMRESVESGDYNRALEELDSSVVARQSRNRLLYHLERSSILNKRGELAASRAELFKADRLVDELYTKSVSKEAATFFINDSMRDYAGEDYEKVAIHIMLALSFLEESKYKKARVEAKKIISRLNEIRLEYDDEYNLYKADAFALYLSGLIFEKLKEYDDAIIDYRKSLRLYEKGFLPNSRVPPSIVKSLYVTAKRRNRMQIVNRLEQKYPEYVAGLSLDNASLIFIGEGYPSIPKISKSFSIYSADGVFRYSWPVIENIYVNDPKFTIYVNGAFQKMELVADLNKIARDNLEGKRLRLTVKNIARLLVKARAANEVERKFGPLAGLLAKLFNAATETADTRSWNMLPGRFYLARVFVKPGENMIDGYGQLTQNIRKSDLKFFILKDDRVSKFQLTAKL